MIYLMIIFNFRIINNVFYAIFRNLKQLLCNVFIINLIIILYSEYSKEYIRFKVICFSISM